MPTSYFSHDSNARNDEKLIRLRMKHGAAGYGVYFMILERLRDEAEYMSVKDYNVIAFDLRVDASLIKDVVENFGLFAFTEDGECFYSESFNNRMSLKDEARTKMSEAGKKGAKKRWNGNAIANAKPSHRDPNGVAMGTLDRVDGKRSKESKEREVKEKNTPLTPQGAGERVLNPEEEFAVEIWPAYPKKGGNYQAGMQAYVQAVMTGETTKAAVLAKIADYKAYIALNKIGSGYVKAGGNWFSGHGWKNEYDTKTPEKTENKQRFGKPQRQEATPEWMNPSYEAPKQEVTDDQKKELAENLAALEELRKQKEKAE